MPALSSQELASDAHQDAIWGLTQQFSVLHPFCSEPGAKKQMLRNLIELLLTVGGSYLVSVRWKIF